LTLLQKYSFSQSPFTLVIGRFAFCFIKVTAFCFDSPINQWYCKKLSVNSAKALVFIFAFKKSKNKNSKKCPSSILLFFSIKIIEVNK
jgi:hypothetical protein